MDSSSSSNQQQPENTYLIDAESGTEMARLLDLDRIATEAMGGLLPATMVLGSGARILDVACGPAGWALKLALSRPDIEVSGIDISARMINFARAYAQIQGIKNTDFRVMDASKPLTFPDQTFDLINMRFALAFMLPENWTIFLLEAVRIARPGGFIRLTESEGFGLTTSPALARLQDLSIQAMQRLHRTYHSLSHTNGIVPMLRLFLKRAGCQLIQTQASAIDFSFGTEAHHLTCQNILVALQLLKPLLVQLVLIPPEEFDHLLSQAESEMYTEDFSSVIYGFSAWGKTPS